MRTAILISGGGTNLQSFIDKSATGELKLDIVVVISNVPDAGGIRRANEAEIPAEVVDHRKYDTREQFDDALGDALDTYSPELIILAGFMRILTPLFIDRFAGRIMNIHPSLLPKYAGLNTHQRALDAGDDWHGSTVHFATAELDGGPRIIQSRVPIEPGDTTATLAARVLETEHEIYPAAAALFAEQRLQLVDGEARLDGQVLEEPIAWSVD